MKFLDALLVIFIGVLIMGIVMTVYGLQIRDHPTITGGLFCIIIGILLAILLFEEKSNYR